MLAWVAYRDKHGPLDIGRRIELSTALIAVQVNRSGGGKAELYDFMPYHIKPGVDLEQAIKDWT